MFIDIGRHYVLECVFPYWCSIGWEKAVYDCGLWEWDLDFGFFVLHKVNNESN